MSYRKEYGLLLLLLAGIAGIWMLASVPTDWMLPCPLHRLTGWRCPFCGGQRMAVCLLQGQVTEALAQNPFLLAILPWGVWGFLRPLFPQFCQRHPRLTGGRLYSHRALLWMSGVALLWGVVRNLFDW